MNTKIFSSKTNSKEIVNNQNKIRINYNNTAFRQKSLDFLPDIIEKIQNNQSQLSLTDKHYIIDIMSIKYFCSFRKDILAQPLIIQKCPKMSVRIIHKQNYNNPLKNYFVLKGKLLICQNPNLNMDKINSLHESVRIRNSRLQKRKKFFVGNARNWKIPAGNNPYALEESSNLQNEKEEDNIFNSIQQFLQTNSGFKVINTIQQLTGYGNIFKNNNIHSLNKIIILSEDSIVACIKNPQNHQQLINTGGLQEQQKFAILKQFTIFDSIHKKLQTFVEFFKLKKYTYNQIIYQQNDIPTYFYLLIKGQIGFYSKINYNTEDQRKKNNLKSVSNRSQMVQSQIMSDGGYFGEEQFIKKTLRTLTVKCLSSECFTLEIDLDKLKHLFDINVFNSLIETNVDIKTKKRSQYLEMANKIHQKFSIKTDNQNLPIIIDKTHQYTELEKGVMFLNNPIREQLSENVFRSKNKTNKMKIMHGINVTTIEPNIKANNCQTLKEQGSQKVFSMLQANQDMYQSTLKKFRRYSIPTKIKNKPEVNWNLKRVWKVLNLESVLREQVQICEPDGLKYYQSHQRYLHHVSQSKSIRPKTSSSNYRTKIQYIAYLQKFKSNKSIKKQQKKNLKEAIKVY